MFNQAAKIMEHVNIAMYIKTMVEYVVYFVYFVYFVYSVYFVYFGMVEYSTFGVVRQSFQALLHITSSPHKHPFFLGVFTIIHHQSSSFITKRQKITCWP